MSSPQIVNPLPFELGQYPPHEGNSRPSSASDNTHGGNGALPYASSSGQFGGPVTSASHSSFDGSQAGHDDGSHPVFVGGDFEGIPTSPNNSSKMVGSDAPTPQNAPPPWMKTEDATMDSFAPALVSHEAQSVPMPIAAAKWNAGAIAYQTSATRGSMPPPSFSISDGSIEGHADKGMFYLSSSMDSFDHSDEERQYQVPPSIQVQIGNQARTSYQPLPPGPYATSFNPRVRPIRTLSAGPPHGFAPGQDGQHVADAHVRHPYSLQSSDMRPVPPLSSSSSTTAPSTAPLHSDSFPDQRTPMTGTMHGHSMPSNLAMESMAINTVGSRQGDQGHQSGFPNGTGFSMGHPVDEQAWRPQTAFNSAHQHMGSSPVPIGRQPPWQNQMQHEGPSMSAPAQYGFGPSSSWQSNTSGHELSTSAWRPNGESLMPKGFPKSPRKHICHQCDKRFNRPSSLQTHMSVHTGAKPYQCPRGDCQRRFSVSSNLRRHMRTHEAKIKKESGSSLEPPEYTEEGEDELQDAYYSQDNSQSQSFGGNQHKYQQPFTPYGQAGSQQQSYSEVPGPPGFFGGQHGYAQPQHSHLGPQDTGNSLSRNMSHSPSLNSQGRSHQFPLYKGRPMYGSAPAGPPAIPSQYASNKQNGLRHGPSMFGYGETGQDQAARLRQQTPSMAGQ